MTQEVIDLLNKDQQSPQHETILAHVRSLVKMSRSRMARHYRDWDRQDAVYRGERWLDSDDTEQQRKGKPTKMVVPNTYAQIHTFSSFLFLMFNQNSKFFELSPSGDDDYGTKRMDCESVLERDLRKSQWNRLLFQHLTDISRFGLGINECSWVKDVTRAYVTPEPVAQIPNIALLPVQLGPTWKEYVKFEGNRIKAVSPYRFFPDTRLPLTDFQRGEFCAAEEEYPMGQLRDMQEAGEVAGVDQIKPFQRNGLSPDARGGETRTTMWLSPGKGAEGWLQGPSQSQLTAIVTKVQVRLVPSKFTVGPGDKKLGPEEHQVLYHVWYANDNRVIKLEPAYAWHDQFSWTVGHFTPDMHRTVNLGLADLIYRLQDVISWHINSRITDVRRNMRGRNVIDPVGIEMSKFDGEGDIFLRKSAARSGVDRWIKQLPVTDVTSGHMNDQKILSDIMEVVTGVNGNAMGQYNSGRRSAQEARVVTAGAAGRMKMHGHLIWETSLGPLGQQMLSNSRQSLSQESFFRVIGQQFDDPPRMDPQTGQAIPGKTGQQKMSERFAAYAGTPEEIICADDYMTFDSTLASEKGFMAQSLNELLSVLLSNPQAAQQFDINPKAVLDEMQELRNGSNTSRFSFMATAGAPAPQIVAPPTQVDIRPGPPIPLQPAPQQ